MQRTHAPDKHNIRKAQTRPTSTIYAKHTRALQAQYTQSTDAPHQHSTITTNKMLGTSTRDGRHDTHPSRRSAFDAPFNVKAEVMHETGIGCTSDDAHTPHVYTVVATELGDHHGTDDHTVNDV